MIMERKQVPYNNENLFTTHYLNRRLKKLDMWDEKGKAKAAYEEIKQIYNSKKERIQTHTNNEAQLEEDFIRPVLRVLGHVFGVQATIQSNAKRPDYGFFRNDEEMDKAFKNKDSDDFYDRSIAIGDAKAWNKDLDKKIGGKEIFENQNPSYQIDYYLRTTKPKWGILTNGRAWRLYFEESPQPIATYYEVDLVRILENDNFEGFKYFYLFFRKKAFTPIGDSFLDKVYSQSLKYAKQIGENLEENVYKALLWLAKGYFNMQSNSLEKSEENVKNVHENSLIFLYRLLFLFYAESKGMLGTEVPSRYSDEYSFAKWVKDILQDIDNDNVNPKGGLYNHRLFSIFNLVREGSEAMGIPSEEFHIPAYNGGLFDSESHPFLNDKIIQDKYIAKVVDLLARVPSEEHKSRSRIDYSDLSLRHLGGIYEGLLEFKPKLAEQNKVAVKKKTTLKWTPASKAKKDFTEFDEDKRVREGEIYLATDKEERKATGSYYTPDPIVEYIVENTVGPVIENKLKGTSTNKEKREAILNMKILDPAMGSGHFLIEAMDFIASAVVKFIEKGEEKKRDIDWARRRVARNCIYGVDVNPLATELAKVSLWLNTMAEDKPLSFLDHHLKTGNSLIGTNIHKLGKHPNDLDEEKETGQLALTGFFGKDVQEDIKELLGIYKEMLGIVEERPEDIKEEEELFQEFKDHPFKKKFDVLSDVKTSYYFGNKFSGDQYDKLLKAFQSGNKKWKKMVQEEWVKKGSNNVPQKLKDNLSDKKGFFHWKLEFPEVFFNIDQGEEKDNPGFDAVIGNPPYFDIAKKLEPEFKHFLESNFEVYTGASDICYFFYEKAFKLLKSEGKFGMITSRYFLEAKEGDKLRNFLSKYQINKIIDFGSEVKVFRDISGEEITIHTLINIADNRQQEGNTKCLQFDGWPVEENNVAELIRWIKEHFQEAFLMRDNYKIFRVNREDLQNADWNIQPELYREILSLIEANSYKTFGDTSDSNGLFHVAKSIESGLGRIEKSGEEKGVFRLTEKEVKENDIEDELLLPMVKTTHIKKYTIKPLSEYLLYVTPDTKLENFPNAKRHLQKFKEELKERHDIKNSDMPWYSLSNLRNRTLYEKKANKIIWPIVSPENKFAFKDKDKNLGWRTDVYYAVPKTTNSIDLYGTLGLCNSALLEFYHKRTSKKRNWGYSYAASYVKQYPLAKPNEDINHLVRKILALKKDKYDEVSGFLDWIRRFWEVKIENLKLHTKLNKYWNYDFSEMMRIASENKSKIKLDTDSRDFKEKVEEEWSRSMNKLTPLLKDIQNLQNQIDALVFQLYDLDKKEVKVVLKSLDTEKAAQNDILQKFSKKR